MDAEELLRRLALNDENVVRSAVGADPLPLSGGPELDAKTNALVRLAALLSIGAATSSCRAAVECARAAGASDAEIVERAGSRRAGGRRRARRRRGAPSRPGHRLRRRGRRRGLGRSLRRDHVRAAQRCQSAVRNEGRRCCLLITASRAASLRRGGRDVLRIGRDEHDGRRAARRRDAARGGKPTEPGHAHVHQDEIGAQRRSERHRTLARRGLAHELEAGRRRDQLPGRHEERRLVVDDQHPDGVGGPTGQVRAGMARVPRFTCSRRRCCQGLPTQASLRARRCRALRREAGTLVGTTDGDVRSPRADSTAEGPGARGDRDPGDRGAPRCAPARWS